MISAVYVQSAPGGDLRVFSWLYVAGGTLVRREREEEFRSCSRLCVFVYDSVVG